MVTETWLGDKTDDNQLVLPNFCIFRDDRNNKKGGGVAVWANRDILPQRLHPCTDKKPDNINCVWIRTLLGLICAIYIPPDCSTTSANVIAINDYIIDSYDEITSAENDSINTFIGGDFNRFDISDICSHLAVENIINCTTRPGSSVPLDLLLVPSTMSQNFDGNVQALPALKDTHNNSQSDHYVMLVPGDEIKANSIYKNVLDFRRSNISVFLSSLTKINWKKLYLLDGDIDEKCALFDTLISPALASIPTSRVLITEKDKPWISPVCQHIVKRINANKNHPEIHEFLKNKLVNQLQQSKKAWADGQIKKTNGIWNIYREHNNSRQDSAILDLVKNLGTENTIKELDSHFTNAYGKQETSVLESYLNFGEEDDWDISTTVDEVKEMLSKLPCKSAGPDNFPSRLLSIAAPILAGPICHLFHVSVQERRFPNLWKRANIVPLPKTAKVKSVSDVRGISLLPIISKLLEKIIIKKHKSELVANFGMNQYAYRSNSSTTCCAIRIHDFATAHLDNPDAAALRILSFDMSRAFEAIPHHLLIAKLASLNLPSGLIRWLASYLLYRTQRVKLFDHYGEWKETSSSVPQGSCLGPILFSIYIANLSCIYKDSLMAKFADDINLCVLYWKKSLADDNRKANDEIVNIFQWAKENGLSLNANKTHQLLCSKKLSTKIPETVFKDESLLRILGFTFQSNLGWDSHIDQVVLNASRKLHALKSLKNTLSESSLIKLYDASVRSVIEYGSQLFIGANKNCMDKLDKIQRRATNILQLGHGDLANLKERRLTAAYKLIAQAKANKLHILNDLVPDTLPRTGKYFIELTNTVRRRKSFFQFMSLQFAGYGED